ncbi:HAD-like domain-containing protein [Tuber borchii]|uniref:HAD-like domain-containing protein n=1 Tax=Tuber borchii TaxID=42251 RepID=A0A2T7A3R8_TUBBO|nr:HAD-like domain-containing protein [Tuber borchii]
MTTNHFSRVAPVAKKYAAILFDLDGTLIDSTAAVIAHWKQFGKDYGIDPALILATSHGRRTIDTLKQWKPELANMDYVREVEGRIPKEHAADAKELPGTRTLVSSLDKAGAKWAIVTSGTSALAEPWVKLMGLPRPEVFVTADKVANGKPDPEGYLLAREQLGLSKTAEPLADVLVVEDAPAGIRAGKAAGCDVLALLTTHSREVVEAAGADFVVEDLESVEWLGKDEDGVLLLINPTPPPTASVGINLINEAVPN